MPSVLYNLAWIREKTAARWDKLMQAGQLSPHDAARLRAATKASDKAGIQRGLQSFVSPLSQQQLARHEAFHEKVTPYVERAYRVKHPSNDFLSNGKNMYVRGTQIYASMPEYLQKIQHWFGSLPPSKYRAGLEHEAAEARMQLASYQGYQKRPFGTHHGPSALIAERLGFQNPDVHAASDLTREENPVFTDDGNSDMLKRLRRHGMVGNYVMPLGGRAHRSADFDRREKRELHLAQLGRLKSKPENEARALAQAQEAMRVKHLTSLTPYERAKGLWMEEDREPNFDKDPAYIAEIERLGRMYFENQRQWLLDKITKQKITDPRVFMATQTGRTPEWE